MIGDYIMTTTKTALTLSKRTLDIFKNFASINSNILVKPGNDIKTVSPIKNVMGKATLEETFDTEFGIWDLNKFLGTVSLFDTPEFEFHENYVIIRDVNKKSEVTYYYSDPRLLTVVDKEIKMPDIVVEFSLTNNTLNDILRAASVLQVSDIVVRSNGDEIEIVALDKNDPTTNNYSVSLGQLPHGDHDFSFYFKAENFKMLTGNYDVSITDKVISQFKKLNDDVIYWVALESDSYYNG
jgi:hypothetical protein|tara:strand:- start:350 stop:1066 length:717 start_codon:yes stop_codon:yes gene_type:complete